MKNELEDAKQGIAHKIADCILVKEQGIAKGLNTFFLNRKSVRNFILAFAFIVLLILNLLSFKYL